MKKAVKVKKADRKPLSLSTSSEFLDIIKQAREEFKSGKKLSLEEMKEEILQ